MRYTKYIESYSPPEKRTPTYVISLSARTWAFEKVVKGLKENKFKLSRKYENFLLFMKWTIAKIDDEDISENSSQSIMNDFEDLGGLPEALQLLDEVKFSDEED